MVHKPENLKEIEERLDRIEQIVSKSIGREGRETQYNIIFITTLIGLIIAILGGGTLGVFRAIYEGNYEALGFPLLIVVLFSIFLSLLYNKLRKILGVGNFVIGGKLKVKNKEDKQALMRELIDSVELKSGSNNSIVNFDLRGLKIFDYLYKTFMESFEYKIGYLIDNIETLKTIIIMFKFERQHSFLNLSFVEKNFQIELNRKHYTYNTAKAVRNNINRIRDNGHICDLAYEGYEGWETE